MRRLLPLAMLGVMVSCGWASADGIPRHYPWARPTNHGFGPHTTSVTWASANPPGWYSNTYNYRWYYPWFAYYNYSSSPYVNWPATGGVAGYSYHGPAGVAQLHQPPAQPYIGQWYFGANGSGSFDTLKSLTTPKTAVPTPMEKPKDEKKDKAD